MKTYTVIAIRNRREHRRTIKANGLDEARARMTDMVPGCYAICAWLKANR